MIPPILADSVAVSSLRGGLQRRAEATANLYYFRHLLEIGGEQHRSEFEKASHELAKAEGYIIGVCNGLAVRYEHTEIRDFLVKAANELDSVEQGPEMFF